MRERFAPPERRPCPRRGRRDIVGFAHDSDPDSSHSGGETYQSPAPPGSKTPSGWKPSASIRRQ